MNVFVIFALEPGPILSSSFYCLLSILQTKASIQVEMKERFYLKGWYGDSLRLKETPSWARALIYSVLHISNDSTSNVDTIFIQVP